MLRDITYSNLIDRLYDLLGVDNGKYELVLKVLYQLGRGIIPPKVITNDENLGFFLDEISISIQHRTLLCVLIVERMIPPIPNLTQDSHVPSFVPKTVEGEKIHGIEVVPSQAPCEAPVNDNPEVEASYSLTMTGEWKTCVNKSSTLALVKMFWKILIM